jgi:hypothetical protein
MIPITLVPPTGEWWAVVYAKDQPKYRPLHAVRNDTGTVITCWRMTWRERLAAVLHGRIYLTMLTFNKPLQPVRLGTAMPEFVTAPTTPGPAGEAEEARE